MGRRLSGAPRYRRARVHLANQAGRPGRNHGPGPFVGAHMITRGSAPAYNVVGRQPIGRGREGDFCRVQPVFGGAPARFLRGGRPGPTALWSRTLEEGLATCRADHRRLDPLSKNKLVCRGL